jgi:hypothetical protein
MTLIAAVVVWLLLRPMINTAVAGLAQTLIRSFEYPRVTRLVIEDDQAQMQRTDLRTDSKVPSVSMTEVTALPLSIHQSPVSRQDPVRNGPR